VSDIKEELDRALQEDALELHATVENILEEINDVLMEERSEKKPARAASGVTRGLQEQLAKIAKDLAGFDREIAELREKEKTFEQGQEGFYKVFKAAVAEVQAAKNRIIDWENENREHVLAKERVDLRHEEVLRQMEQAGRRAEDFANAKVPDGMHESDLHEMERRLFRLRGDLASMGEVDHALMKEAQDTEVRYTFLSKESEDLERAVADLVHLMQDLSEKIKTEFDKSLTKINEEFGKFFALMFGGGTAKLRVEKPRVLKMAGDDDEEGDGEKEEAEEEAATMGIPEAFIERDGGVDIDIRLPRKKVTSLDMLSGGERSLVGIAALFAMVAVSPPPFLVLDEIDAPLDERNARRFGDMLKEFSKRTQFLVVTHNRATMEAADILYGVTLDEDGSSKIVSLKLEPTAT
jgi:chromosome segregation protein